MHPKRIHVSCRNPVVLALVLGTLAWAAPATAQPSTFRVLCTTYGSNSLEPVGDREGHSIQAAEAACVTEGGALDGTVTTQNTLWEFDKGAGTMLSSHGFSRKPGAVAAYANSSGTLTFQTSEGKVTGWLATGKGRYLVATGSAAALTGKTYGWQARPTGPRTYVVDVALD